MRMEDDELRLLIMRVARRIRNERAGDALSDSQLAVLFKLEHDDHSPGDLAAFERVTPPSMNRTVNGLERAGLVQRHPAEDDARRVRITITDAGRAYIAETRALRTAWLSRQLAAISPGERAAIEAVLPVLRKFAES
jgi:DNA-binding MarR family transcriptional regulator